MCLCTQELLGLLKGSSVLGQTHAYHTVHFVNGTECDITGQPRSAKVEIFCTVEGVDTLVEVKEDTTCDYTLRVQTPLLCQHPMLLPLSSSTPRHTLSCTPVVSQLDYEDFLLKQELIRQQKEKLKVLSKDTSGAGRREKESLLSNDHLLLRQLVMSSITQLAEIAYDTGSFGLGGREGERELDEIDDDDKEVAGTSLQSSSITERWSSLAGRSRSKGQSSEDRVQGDEQEGTKDGGGRVSEKMKRMAEDVKSTGKDSAALESLLSNLAVTAQYIESLDGNNRKRGPSNTDNDEAAPDETGEPGDVPNGEEPSRVSSKLTNKDDASAKGPPPLESNIRETRTVSEAGSTSDDGRTVGRSISSEILAASEEEKDEEELELDPEAVREVEQQLQEALAKQFDTNDVTVKIITLPEDQVQEEMETEGGVEGGTGREDHLADAMSLLLDSLLNGSDEPVSEDKERQSELAAGYDQVWGRQPRKRRTLKDTL
ncbi:Protein OS-9 [Geodia barretti]|uniref:Protein OS-9 n=1 Tax=Geodia barretti TaxID=519541 RepID=A0AA35VRN2_GEOBA|nr:Protein OS-9 [Geodia barretti]